MEWEDGFCVEVYAGDSGECYVQLFWSQSRAICPI